MATEITGDLQAKGLKFAIVVSRFNHLITDHMLAGCVDCLVRHGAADRDITVVRVPGAFEIPQAVAKVAKAKKPSAIIALGAVIRGGTQQSEQIAAAVTRGLADVAVESGVAVANGVITPDTIEQAVERAGTKMGNKGTDAAMSAIEMANLAKKLSRSR